MTSLIKDDVSKIMFNLIKQVFIVLLSFSSSLARHRTTCRFLNNEPCIVRPTLIDLNPVELKYYPCMIRLDRCTGSCNILKIIEVEKRL